MPVRSRRTGKVEVNQPTVRDRSRPPQISSRPWLSRSIVSGEAQGVRARARNIEIALPIPEDAHVATGEFRRVLQILINLIGNAIAYSPENSVVTVKAKTHSKKGLVSVSVADEGPGIDPEQATRIFNKFERLGRVNDGGSGLGLYISSRLAEAMQGTLEVANPGEEGAVFKLTLPVRGA